MLIRAFSHAVVSILRTDADAEDDDEDEAAAAEGISLGGECALPFATVSRAIGATKSGERMPCPLLLPAPDPAPAPALLLLLLLLESLLLLALDDAESVIFTFRTNSPVF